MSDEEIKQYIKENSEAFYSGNDKMNFFEERDFIKGSLGIPLFAKRSIAVNKKALEELDLSLDIPVYFSSENSPEDLNLNRLGFAHGSVNGDRVRVNFFCGTGRDATEIARKINDSSVNMYVLLLKGYFNDSK